MRPSMTAGLAAGLLLLAITRHAAGDDVTPLNDRFSLDLGAYFMASDTTIRADQIDGIGVGTEINLEDLFGFDEEDVFRLEGKWRFAPKHKLRLMYFDSKRTARESLGEQIHFGDTTFPIDVGITARFDFEIIQLAYEYEFLRRENFELGASLGVHHVSLLTQLTVTADIGNEDLEGTLDEKLDTDAPLPVVGLRGVWHLGNDFYLQGHVQYFQLAYGDYDGRLLDYQAGLIWQFSKRVAVGAAYNLFDARIDFDTDDFQGHLDWNYDGPQLFLRAAF